MALIIAIDGPAGSGKSTVAREVARKLHFSYVDTGAIYRCLAFRALDAHVLEIEEETLAKLAADLPLEIRQGESSQLFILDNQDVTQLIRTEQISRLASVISGHKKVRLQLLELQRRLGKNAPKGAVLEGRDIGTVVFPDASFKFFLTASHDERAKRRFEELESRGEIAVFEDVKREIIERDERDSNRDVAPMVASSEAHVIDTTLLSLDKVIEQIIEVINESN